MGFQKLSRSKGFLNKRERSSLFLRTEFPILILKLWLAIENHIDRIHRIFSAKAITKFLHAFKDFLFSLRATGGDFYNCSFQRHRVLNSFRRTNFPTAEFKNVDVVILSNLKYCHAEAREFHDWTLKNVLLLPLVNPHGRSTLLGQSITKGLGIFDHHLKPFANYHPTSLAGNVPSHVMEGIKVNCYDDDLPKEDNERFFPVKRPEQMQSED